MWSRRKGFITFEGREREPRTSRYFSDFHRSGREEGREESDDYTVRTLTVGCVLHLVKVVGFYKRRLPYCTRQDCFLIEL